MVRLALYKGKGQIGNAAIRAWTGSVYSHCELVVGDRCYSSSIMDGGVRCKSVGPRPDQISLSPDHWDQVELPWADAARVIRHFKRTDHYRYGWFALITSQVLNRNMGTAGAAFCSAWCADALGLPTPLIYAPGALAEQCKFLNGFALRALHLR